MDVCEVLQRLHRKKEADSITQQQQSPLPADKDNGTFTRPSRSREARSKYKSPTPSVPRRSVSPNATRTGASPSAYSAPKRALSADRKRPSTPPSPSPSQSQPRRITAGNKMPEMLWPSTSVAVSKKDKPVSQDRALKPTVTRKAAPESRRSPLKGKNSSPSNQSENSRPADGFQAISKSRVMPSVGISSLRRLSAEGIPGSLRVNTVDAAGRGGGHALIDEITKTSPKMNAVDDALITVSRLHKLNMPKTCESPSSVFDAPSSSRSLPGSRLPSPSKVSVSRGMASASWTRPSTSASAKGTSPSRIRPSSPPQQMSSACSVFSFVPDTKKGKKGSNQFEDAHHLRLLYNTYLQWRFANAQADASLQAQKLSAEETLYNVWRETLELRNSITMMQIDLQQLQLQQNLNVVLNDQLSYLEDWASLEGNHSALLAGAIEDLKSSILLAPITGGAIADIVSLKAAISSAVAVMQGMISSISSFLTKVEGTGVFVSELADLAAEERAMLEDCETILASTADVQEEEYSLRALLIQQFQG